MKSLQKAKSFLENNKLASLATISENGTPEVAVVYYTYHNGHIYFLTEKKTKKAINILKHKKLALVIVQEQQLEMLQIEGYGEMIIDPDERLEIVMQLYDKLRKNNSYDPWPILQLHAHDLEAFQISMKRFKYSHFTDETVIIEGTASDWSETIGDE